MLKARLLDLEGQTVAEHVVAEPPPRWIEMAAAPKIECSWAAPEEPITPALSIKRIVFALERQDGGGTLIYRRLTGPWG